MSFKRDGDDLNWLALLRKRRTDELLSENIPDGEAKLLSNGRLACLVCHHKPVFDTIKTLHVHRGGKKHAAAAAHQRQARLELSDLLQKRRHEDITQRGSTTASLPSSSAARILPSSCPYDPKSSKNKITDRKRRLNLSDDLPQSLGLRNGYDKVVALDSPHLTFHRQPKQLKNIFPSPANINRNTAELRPYMSAIQNNSNTTNMRRSNVDSSREIRSSGVNCGRADIGERVGRVGNTAPCNFSQGQGSTIARRANERGCKSREDKTLKMDKKRINPAAAADIAKLEAAKRHLKLFESGWKKNRSGEWIKDEDCEFDTDEEDPNCI